MPRKLVSGLECSTPSGDGDASSYTGLLCNEGKASSATVSVTDSKTYAKNRDNSNRPQPFVKLEKMEYLVQNQNQSLPLAENTNSTSVLSKSFPATDKSVSTTETSAVCEGQMSCLPKKHAESLVTVFSNKQSDMNKASPPSVLDKNIALIEDNLSSDEPVVDALRFSVKDSTILSTCGVPAELTLKPQNPQALDTSDHPHKNVGLVETEERENSLNSFIGFTKEMILHSPIAKTTKSKLDVNKQERKRRQKEKQQAFKMKMKEKHITNSTVHLMSVNKAGTALETSSWDDGDDMVGEG